LRFLKQVVLLFKIFKKQKIVNIMHTTNYFNTFIEVAEDCPTATAEIPKQKGDDKTIANLHFDMIMANPYQYTSDDVIFNAFATKNNISEDLQTARDLFFSKGQACLRASPLTKRYGWGVHSNAEGKVAIFPVESAEYQQFTQDSGLKKTRGMRSKRA
jgi:hypothetical protein